MNKIFKVIFNHTTQTWAAVSELAKGYCKSSSNNTIEVLDGRKESASSFSGIKTVAITSAMMMVVVPNTFAVTADLDKIAVDSNEAIAIAGGTSEARGSIAIGKGAGIAKTRPDWVKPASVVNSIAIGTNAEANGLGVVSLGTEAKTNNQDSVAIGYKANTNKQQSTAIGYLATVSSSASTYSVALGATSEASATNTVADLKFKTDNGETTATIAAKEANSVLSIGNSNHKRQIVNVAAGRVSQDSTDAVNGSQLYAVMKNSGFNIQQNGSTKSRINNDGLVNFTDGSYTTAVVTDGDNSSSVKMNVVTQDISTDAKGVTSVSGNTAGLTTAKTVSDAINNAFNNSSFSIKANGDAGAQVKRNGYIDIQEGKNINVTRDGSTITVKTVDNPNFTTVNAGTVNADQVSSKNLTVSGTSNLQTVNINQQLSANGDVNLGGTGKTINFVSGSTINANNNQIKGVADGTNPTDAVNKRQLDAVNTIATTANNTANTANTIANTANTTANTANTTANTANTTANTANTTANTANTTANTANTTANTANTTANTANTTANTANTTANTANTTANTANTTANTANTTANTANTTANTANTTANTANTTANTANTTANTANTTANTANTTANTANTTANTANTTANTANTTANTANTTANTANTTANTANTTANTANTTANTALNKVNQGWNINTGKVEGGNVEGNSSTNVQMGETVKVIAGKNLNITQNGKEITLSVNDSPNFTSITTSNGATIGGNLTVNGSTNLNNVTLEASSVFDAGGNRLTNLSNATAGNDATTLSQVQGLITNATTNASNINTTNLSAGNATITNLTTTNGTITNLNSTNGTITNLNSTNGTITNLNSTNGTITNLNSDNIVANNGTFNTTLVSKGETTLSGNTTIGGANKTFNIVNGTTVNMGNNVVSGVANGTAPTDAVNKQQLDAVANTPLNFTGNSGETSRKLGQTLNITGTATTSGNYTSKNVKTVVTEGKVEIQVAENPEFETISTTGNANIGGNLSVNGTTTTKDLNVTNNATVNNLTATNGTITSLNSTNGTITNLNSTNGTITNLNSTNGTITNLNSTNGTITNLNSTNGTITNLNSTNGTITNLNSTNGIITNLNSTNGTITNLNSTNGTITNLNSTNGIITNLNSTNGTITNLNSTNGTITNLNSTNGTFSNSLVSTGNTVLSGNTTVGGEGKTFTVANGTKVDMGGNVISNISDGNISAGSKDAITGGQLHTTIQNITNNLTNQGMNFTGNNGEIIARKLGETLTVQGSLAAEKEADSSNIRTVSNATTGAIEIVMAKDPTFRNLNATGNATVGGDLGVNGTTTTKDLNVTNNATINNLTATNGTITNLNSTNGTITNLNSTNGTITNLNSTNGTITNLNSTNGTITNLNSTNGTITNLNSTNGTFSNSLVSTGNTVLSGNTTVGGEGKTFTVANGTKVDMGGNVISNITDGNISADSKDAITGGQLHTTIQNITNNLTNQGMNFTGNNGEIIARKLGETLTVQGSLAADKEADSSNIRTISNATTGAIEIVMAKDPTFRNLNATGNATVGGDLGVNGTTTTKDLNVTNNATINNLTATNGTITNLNSTNGTITNLNSTNGTITNLNSTNGTITNLNSTNGTITNLNSTNGTITNLNSTNGTITNLNSTNGTITNLNSTNGTITNLNSTNGTITNLNSTNGTITNLNSTNGTITNLNSTNGTITNLNSTNGTITNLNSTNGTITNLNSTNGTITNLNSTNGTITNLNSTNGTFSNSLVSTGNTILSGNTTVGGEGKTFTVANGTKVDMGGNVISNITDGNISAGSKDAITGGQLHTTIQNITNSLTNQGMNFTGNNGEIIARKLGETLTVQGSLAADKEADSSNIRTVANATTGAIEIVMAKDPTFRNLNATGNATVGGDLGVNGTTTTKDLNVTNNATINNLTATNGTITNLNSTNGTITNLNSTNGTITNLNSTNGTITNLNSTNGTITNLNSTNGTITNLNSTNGTITNLNSTNGIITNLNSTNGTITNLNSTNGTITNLNSTNGTFSNSLVSTGNTVLSGNTTVGGEGKTFTVANGTKVDMGGNVISNISDGNISAGSKDAITGGQLHTTIQNITNSLTNQGMNFTGNNGEIIARKLGETLTVQGSLAADKEADSSNIRTVSNATTGAIEIVMAKDPTFRNLNATGNATVGGDLGVNGTTTTKDLVVNNNATIAKDLAVKGDATVDGTTTTKDLVVNNNATIAKDLAVKGDATVDGTTTTKDLVVNNNATIAKDLAVKGDATVDGTTTTKDLVVNNNATIAKDLAVKGDATIDGTTTTQDLVVNGDSLTKGNSTVEGNLTVEKDLNVEGHTSLQDVTIHQSLTLADNAKIDLGNSDIEGNFNIYGDTDKKPLSQALDQLQMTGPLVYVDPKTNKDVQRQTEVVRVNSGSDKPVRVTNVADPKDASDAVNLGYFDKKLSLNMGDVHNRINRVDRRLRSGIASAVAMSLLPQSYRAGESIVSVGGGTYRGASAIAVGYSRVTDNGRVVIKIGGSANNSGDYAGGAAVGWKF